MQLRPPTVSGALVRAALLAAVDRRWELPLVVLHGGAGFGKTTLLAQAIEQNELAPKGVDLWLSLDAGDSAASHLLARLCHLLSGGDRPLPDDPTIDDVVQLLALRSPTHVAVLLDDAHRLERSSSGETVLNDLLKALPGNAHLVVASRRAPELEIARLVAHQQVEIIDEDRLRLDAQEAAELARRRGAEPDSIDTYGGWPALVDLAARGGVSVAADFVWEEVLANHGPAARRALEAAVLIDGHRFEVIDEICAQDGAAEALQAVPLVGWTADGALRPHHLWGELLFSRNQPDPELLDRAVAVLGNLGESDRVYELFAAAGDWDRALPALFRATSDQHRPPYRGQMVRWRQQVPAAFAERPEVLYLDGMILRSERPWDRETVDLFERAMSGFDEAGDRRSMVVAGLRGFFVPYSRCDGTALTSLLSKMMRADEQRPLATILESNPATAALLAFLEQDHATFEHSLDNVELDEVEPRLRFFLPLMQADRLMVRGDLDAALPLFAAAEELAAECDQAAGTLEARVRVSIARFLQGDLGVALHMQLPNDLNRYTLGEQLEARAWKALLHLHVGRLADAEDELRIINDVGLAPLDLPRVSAVAALAEAALAAQAGDDAGAVVALAPTVRDGGLVPNAESSALLWQPALAAMLDEEFVALLDPDLCRPGGRAALELGVALAKLRSGTAWRQLDVAIDEVDWVMCRLPFSQSIELGCWARAGADQRGTLLVDRGFEINPEATREALRRLAPEGGRLGTQAKELLAELPVAPSAPVSVGVLGPTTLWRNGEPVDEPDWRRERTRTLLALVVHHREITRERAAAALWPEVSEDRARANLRLTLHYLQGCLEPDRHKADPPYFLHQEGEVVRLAATDGLRVDVWEFERLLDAAGAARRAAAMTLCLEHLEAALAYWRGEYLADLPDAEWCSLERTRLTVRFVRATVEAGALQLAAGRTDDALASAHRALDAEPWSEEAYRVMVSAHLAQGDRAAALRAIESCRSMLDELGVGPAAETEMLERLARRPQ